MVEKETALIVGAGQGLSASLARLFAAEGMDIAIAARNTGKLSDLCNETGAKAYACDAVDAGQVDALFSAVTADFGEPDVVVYNASNRARGPVQDLDPDAVRTAIEISCFGGFLVAQAAAKQMIARNSGTILLTGASASVKGYPNSSSLRWASSVYAAAQSARRNCSRRIFTSPISLSMAESYRDRATAAPQNGARMPCCCRMRSPRITCTSTASTGPPGLGK